MKKALLIVLMLPFWMNAQRSMQKYYQMNTQNLGLEFNEYEPHLPSLKLRKEAGIKQVKAINTSKKGKKTESQMTYNQQGRLVFSESKYQTIDNSYENDTLLVATIKHRKRNTYETNSTFNNGKLETRKVFKNGKLQSSSTLNYDANGKVASSQMTSGRKSYEIRYTYNDESKMTKSVYLINGKVKKEWIYECKPEGQVVASKTEEISSVCTYREESADGSYTTFTRSLQDGKPHLLKRTFNKDSVQIEVQRFVNDSILIWETKTENNVETDISYRKSGKKRYMQISVRNEKGGLVSKEYLPGRKSRSLSKSVYQLNEDGTTKSRTHYWKGKPNSTAQYEYVFFQ